MENLRDCRFVIIGGKKNRAQDFYLPEDAVDLRGRLSMTESAEALRRATNPFIFSTSSSAAPATPTATAKPA